MTSPSITTSSDAVVAPDVAPGDFVQVDASDSVDADAQAPCSLTDPLTYTWAFDLLPPGSSAALNGAVTNPSFQTDAAGAFRVLLTVTDSTGRSDTATLTVTAQPCTNLNIPGGFTCATVKSGNAQGLSTPRGVTVDSSSNVYVVNNGSDEVVRITTSGSLTTFASPAAFSGGPTLEDIVFDSATDLFFVTDSGNSEIVSLSSTATPAVFATAANTPEGIATFTTCAGQNRLLVAAQGEDLIRMFNPATAPTAPSLMSDLMQTSGGTDLAISPRGVAGRCETGTNRLFATKTGGTDSLVRDTANIGGTFNAAVTQSSSGLINNPRDVVLTPCPTPKLVVAGRGTGDVALVDNCGGGCTTTSIVTGLSQPWGLWFESATSLLVTDEATDTLYRIAGPFCSL